MEISDLRKRIDEIDSQLVALLNERARAAHAIGVLKRSTNLPIYEPERERVIHENVGRVNRGPLQNHELRQIFERIVDVMREIQKKEIAPVDHDPGRPTELEEND
jgi:chorismate mutase-like protein